MLSIIVAIGENNIIGGDNKLLWHIPNDLKRFKEITSGHTIVMGRKTFQSLPKTLPNRYHVVITRDESFKFPDKNVEVVYSVDDIIRRYKTSKEEVFVIGGGEIYKQLLPHCERIYLTKVKKAFEGDTYFPDIDETQWKVNEVTAGILDDKNKIPHEFITLTKY